MAEELDLMDQNAEDKEKDTLYREACALMQKASDNNDIALWQEAAEAFEKLGDWRYAEENLDNCRMQLHVLKPFVAVAAAKNADVLKQIRRESAEKKAEILSQLPETAEAVPAAHPAEAGEFTEKAEAPIEEAEKLPEEAPELIEEAKKLPEQAAELIEEAEKLPEQAAELIEEAKKLPEQAAELIEEAERLPEQAAELIEEAAALPENIAETAAASSLPVQEEIAGAKDAPAADAAAEEKAAPQLEKTENAAAEEVSDADRAAAAAALAGLMYGAKAPETAASAETASAEAEDKAAKAPAADAKEAAPAMSAAEASVRAAEATKAVRPAKNPRPAAEPHKNSSAPSGGKKGSSEKKKSGSKHFQRFLIILLILLALLFGIYLISGGTLDELKERFLPETTKPEATESEKSTEEPGSTEVLPSEDPRKGDYKAALALMEAGRFKEAAAAFDALGDYGESRKQRDYCLECLTIADYEAAMKLFEEGSYAEAKKAFEALGGFSDAKDWAEKCSENIAKQESEAAEKAAEEAERAAFAELLKNTPVGGTFCFGKLEQDNDPAETEDVSWLVLEKQDDRVLVISEKILAAAAYHTQKMNVSWEESAARSFMNSELLNSLFTEKQQELLLGDDKLFLLSAAEAEKFFSGNAARQAVPTAKARAEGASINSDNGNGSWWLSTPGTSSMSEVFVRSTGAIDYNGCEVTDGGDSNVKARTSIRPAMWVKIPE